MGSTAKNFLEGFQTIYVSKYKERREVYGYIFMYQSSRAFANPEASSCYVF